MWHPLPQQQHQQAVAGRPPLIGIDYGGANTGIVHANRLVLAGSQVVPDLVLASYTGFRPVEQEYVDVDFGLYTKDGATTSEPEATEEETADLRTTDQHAFWFRQTTPRQNTFHAMLAQEGLFFFGDLGEANVPPGPFSSAQVVMREGSWYGSDIGRTVLIVGGLAIFVQTGGRDVRGFEWEEQHRKHEAVSLLTLAGDVFETAYDMTYIPSTGRDGETVVVIDTDGNAAVAVIAADRPQPAWSTWKTGPANHRLLAATSPRGRTTFLVDRGGHVALETLVDPGDAPMDCEVTIAPGDMLPEWTDGLDATVLGVRKVGEGTEEDVDTFTVSNRRLVGVDADTTHVVGLRYLRTLETTQFVKHTQTGTSGRVRPARIVDAAVDFVKPPGLVLPPKEWLDLVGTTFSVVPYSRRGKRRSYTGKPPRRDTDRICSVRYPARSGWRDRIAVELVAERHVEIAGIAYRAAA